MGIPLAEVLSLRGRARFIDHDPTSASGIGIGYVLDLQLTRIEPAKIPKKYSKDRPVPGSTLSESAITTPNYVIEFNIELHDKDGFIVAAIAGPEHLVDAGKINKITGQTKQNLSRQQAALVRSVTVSTHFKTIPGARVD